MPVIKHNLAVVCEYKDERASFLFSNALKFTPVVMFMVTRAQRNHSLTDRQPYFINLMNILSLYNYSVIILHGHCHLIRDDN